MLCRKILPRVSANEKDCPDIGHIVEEFVQQANVGADACRRTGVLAFDGNVKISKKVNMSEHLEDVYHCHFLYSSVVELYVARNKRHHSAQHYKDLAQVTTRIQPSMFIGVGLFLFSGWH